MKTNALLFLVVVLLSPTFSHAGQSAVQDIGPNKRLQLAASVLKRKLTPVQKRTLIKAHLVGLGEVGKDGSPARVGNYTQKHIADKARILKSGGFDKRGERRALMKKGVVGVDYVPGQYLGANHYLTTDGRLISRTTHEADVRGSAATREIQTLRSSNNFEQALGEATELGRSFRAKNVYDHSAVSNFWRSYPESHQLNSEQIRQIEARLSLYNSF